MAGKFWNDREDAILKENYATASWEELRKFLRRRTRAAITLHAEQNLKLRRLHPRRPWTKQEDKILLEHYSTSPWPTICKLLPGRVRNSISIHANRLEINRRISSIGGNRKESSVAKMWKP